ncbi:MAG: DEAD/DEAH box helicase [Bacteroidota bacterium]|nr:DEAD/DEAH box helicase [Bacteroidota bacterium]
MNETNALHKFHPVVRSWFEKKFGTPSPPQQLGWTPIAEGKNTLIVAPTGSGKTLAAFLWCINHLVVENIAHPPLGLAVSPPLGGEVAAKAGTEGVKGVRVVYISPLKALNNDIHRNLEIPLKEILEEAHAQKIPLNKIRSAVRTGDTTTSERRSMLHDPPDILITTPESLYLMLTSPQARKLFTSVRYIIVDEIHALCGNKRGVHLSLTLERLEHIAGQPPVRIGLSATQRPLDVIARFLGGQQWVNNKLVPRDVTIVDAGYKKEMDLKVICAARDFSDLPLDSIWHLIFPQLLQQIETHRTTLIFVNNRRLAERVAAQLNELLTNREHTFNMYAVPHSTQENPQSAYAFAPADKSSIGNRKPEITVHAYHGSMSRTTREKLESGLKEGKLKALVTTSALELGIDIGSIDLVVQIQSPKGIARGLQRVGRSGHLVSAQSKGRIYPTHREDLLEAAVVAKEMNVHAIEQTHVPINCLDVLAQQIVAMVSVEEWNVDELFTLLRQSYCYHALTRNLFINVLQMLAGRYTNEVFRELRARISWDMVRNALSALPGSFRLAITNSGTISDRGYFGVYLEDKKTKIGEVDEEFIYESRAGDTFILGSNIWKMLDIDTNKVMVAPAPGQPARMPFWRGEGIGRTFELGTKIGEFFSNAEHSFRNPQGDFQQNDFLSTLKDHYPIDSASAWNLGEYLRTQFESTGAIPSHTKIVVEGFRDEIGDPRIVVHSCFGRGVNGLLGLVLLHQFKKRMNIEVQMLYNDDGILLRCSDVERLPLDLFSELTSDEAQEIVLEELMMSPLFGGLFRQNAERAMLLPKLFPGKRTPLFLQRLRAGDLLQIARQYDDFPIVIESVREALNDVLDFEHCKEIVKKIETGEIQLHTVQTETPSPFAAGVLFDFAAVYMYEWDKPKHSAQETQRALNRELLSEIVDFATVKPMLRSDAVIKVTEHLQCTAPTRVARTPEELLEMLIRIGELTREEIAGRSAGRTLSHAVQLLTQHSASSIMLHGIEYLIASEEIPFYRAIAKISDESLRNLPKEIAATEISRSDTLCYIVLRTLRSHGPLTTEFIAHRYGIDEDECREVLSLLSKKEPVERGKFSENATHDEWCYRPNLDRMHRASIALLRREIKPATMADFTNFLLQWQHCLPFAQEAGDSATIEIIEQLQALPLSAELWEPEILRRRIQRYDPAEIRALTSRGEVLCIGTNSGKVQWILRGEGSAFLPEGYADTVESLSSSARGVHDYLKENGASFLSDLREGMNISLAALNKAIAELFWNGLITNDVFDEILHVKRFRTAEENVFPDERIVLTNPRHNPLKFRAVRSVRAALKNVPGWNGRWSLTRTRNVFGQKLSPEEQISRRAEQLLHRYGIVAREIVKREENFGSWTFLAMEFQKLELRGEIRRGYFVEGLSGMQFALPAAVEMLRSVRSAAPDESPVVLNACDPANPYGSGIELSGTFSDSLRMMRVPSNYLVLHQGMPIVWIENDGARVSTVAETNIELLRRCLAQFVEYLRSVRSHERAAITIEHWNNLRPTENPAAEILRSIGFYRDRVQTMRLEL